jgi:hypothetical protein
MLRTPITLMLAASLLAMAVRLIVAGRNAGATITPAVAINFVH